MKESITSSEFVQRTFMVYLSQSRANLLQQGPPDAPSTVEITAYNPYTCSFQWNPITSMCSDQLQTSCLQFTVKTYLNA